MKKLLFVCMVLSAVSVAQVSLAQEQQPKDTSLTFVQNVEETPLPTVVYRNSKSKTKKQSISVFKVPEMSVLKSGKMLMKHEFSTGILIGKDNSFNGYDDKLSAEDQQEVQEKTELSTNFGLNAAYRLIFMPGNMTDNTFVINPYGFGFSLGADIAGDIQRNSGFTCDILFAAGIEAGIQRIGCGIDFLVGAGSLSGFELSCDLGSEPVSEEDVDLDIAVDKNTKMVVKYGIQIWIRAPLLSGIFGGNSGLTSTFDRFFVRYIRNNVKGVDYDFDDQYLTVQTYPEASLQIGICHNF